MLLDRASWLSIIQFLICKFKERACIHALDPSSGTWEFGFKEKLVPSSIAMIADYRTSPAYHLGTLYVETLTVLSLLLSSISFYVWFCTSRVFASTAGVGVWQEPLSHTIAYKTLSSSKVTIPEQGTIRSSSLQVRNGQSRQLQTLRP